MIKNKEDFKGKYIDLSNEKLNGKITKEIYNKLDECLDNISDKDSHISEFHNFTVYQENFIYLMPSYDDNDSIFSQQTELPVDKILKEISIWDIKGMNKEDFYFVLGKNIREFKYNSEIEKIEKEDFENRVEIEKGSRLWAFKMLDEGKRIRHKSWLNKTRYLEIDSCGISYCESDGKFVTSGNYISYYTNGFPKDGWELYEDKQPKTMTFEKAILNIDVVKFTCGDFTIEKCGDKIYKINVAKKTIEYLSIVEALLCKDKQVEIIEGVDHGI